MEKKRLQFIIDLLDDLMLYSTLCQETNVEAKRIYYSGKKCAYSEALEIIQELLNEESDDE